MKTIIAFLILALAFTVGMVLSVPGTVYAQSVTQPIVCTMANSGSPATLILSENPSGPSLSPNTVVCDGTLHSITADPSVTLVATEPADLTDTRDRFIGGSTTIQVTTCTTGTCTVWAITDYEQDLNTFEVTANAQTDFDAAMTWTLGCYQEGSAGACSISSTVAATDSSQIWTDYGATVTFPATPNGAPSSSRWEASGSLSYTPTSGGNTEKVGYWKQWMSTFQAVARAQPAFDSGLSSSVLANSLGSTTSVCEITTVASQSSASCTGWVDNGAVATLSPLMSGAAPNTQWVCTYPCTTSAVNVGGDTYPIDYFKQVSESFDYSVVGGGSGYSSPSLACDQLGGSAQCAVLSTSPASYWIDYGSAWSATTPLFGSTTGERWSSDDASGSSMAGGRVTVVYYNQFGITVKYALAGGGAVPSAPTISYDSFGTSTTSPLSSSATVYWMDSGQSFVISQVSGASGERWVSPVSTFQVLDGATYSITLYHQFAFQLSYSVTGGGSGYSAPEFSYVNFTATLSLPLSQSNTPFWVDSGTPWNVTNPLVGSGGTERWQTGQQSSGESASAVTEVLTYYHQYLATFGFTVIGGGSGYGNPVISFSQFGQAYSAIQGWADAGGTYTYTDPLNGSTPTERWYTADAGGIIANASSIMKTYYYQFAFTTNYQVLPSGSGYAIPSVNFTALGMSESELLPSSPSVTWLDSSTLWSATSVLGGSNSLNRWATEESTSGAAIAPETIVFTYYKQFLANFTYSVRFGGSPQPPAVNYLSFGSATQTNLSEGSAAVWTDANSAWSFPDLLGHSGPDERWISNSTLSGTSAAPSTFTVVYLHQYMLRTFSDTLAGGSFLNSTGWHDNGATVMMNATSFIGWKFIYWQGVGGGAYNGSSAYQAFGLRGPANETAIFYPGLTITSAGGGFVNYVVGNLRGNITGTEVVYVPLLSNVTLTAYPQAFDYIFVGWSQYIQGAIPITHVVAASPHAVTASFSLDYPDLTVVAVFLPIILIMTVYILVVRRVRRRPPT